MSGDESHKWELWANMQFDKMNPIEAYTPAQKSGLARFLESMPGLYLLNEERALMRLLLKRVLGHLYR